MEHCVLGRTSAVISRLSPAWLWRAVKGRSNCQTDNKTDMEFCNVCPFGQSESSQEPCSRRSTSQRRSVGSLLYIYNQIHEYLKWIGLILFSFITVTITTWQPDRLSSPNHKHAIELRQHISSQGRTWCHFVSFSSLVPLK